MFYLRPCANCGVLIQGGRNLFCTDLCRQAAKAVRYARGVQADGRIEFLDVQEAVAAEGCPSQPRGHGCDRSRHLGPRTGRTAHCQVHRPLWERIEREAPLQPSDTPGWAWRQWASTVPGKAVATRWLAWSEERPAATPEIAAAGFPAWLKPQLWFGEGKPIG